MIEVELNIISERELLISTKQSQDKKIRDLELFGVVSAELTVTLALFWLGLELTFPQELLALPQESCYSLKEADLKHIQNINKFFFAIQKYQTFIHLTQVIIFFINYCTPSPVLALVSKYAAPFSLLILSTSDTFFTSSLLPMIKNVPAPLSFASLTQQSMLSTLFLLERSQKIKRISISLQNQFLISMKSSFPLKSQKVTFVTVPLVFQTVLFAVQTPKVVSDEDLNQPDLIRLTNADLPVVESPTTPTLICLISF